MISRAFSEVSLVSWRVTSTYGLISTILSRALSSLGRPMSEVPWMTCRCRLEASTSSKSTMPMWPTPAAARYMALGEPRPPAPISSTLAFFSRFCPSIATSGMIRCRDSSPAGSTSAGNAMVLVPSLVSKLGPDPSDREAHRPQRHPAVLAHAVGSPGGRPDPVDLDLLDAVQTDQHGVGRALDHVGERAGGRGEGHVEPNLVALFLEVDAVDEAEVDHVDPQLRVLDLHHRVQHLCLGGHGGTSFHASSGSFCAFAAVAA